MREFSIIKQNILKYLEFIGMTQYKFYQETGITRGVLGQNNGMSEENTSRFLDCFNEVSPEWLLTGKGNMLKEEVVKENVLREPEESYGIDYKELYLREKEIVDILKKQIRGLESQLGIKRKAG